MSIRKGTTTIAGNVMLDSTPTQNSTRGVTSGGVYNIPHIITTYINGASGYNIWSNGYCEQWGYVTNDGSHSSTALSVSLFKTFSSTNYNLQITSKRTTSTDSTSLKEIGYQVKNSGSFTKISSGNTNYEVGFDWLAKGYLATGQY